MDELVVEVAKRLIDVHRTLGMRAFQDAVQACMVGIAAAAHREAERRAGVSSRKGTVLRFPLGRTGRASSDPG